MYIYTLSDSPVHVLLPCPLSENLQYICRLVLSSLFFIVMFIWLYCLIRLQLDCLSKGLKTMWIFVLHCVLLLVCIHLRCRQYFL